jgi:hypothetical protein
LVAPQQSQIPLNILAQKYKQKLTNKKYPILFGFEMESYLNGKTMNSKAEQFVTKSLPIGDNCFLINRYSERCKKKQ